DEPVVAALRLAPGGFLEPAIRIHANSGDDVQGHVDLHRKAFTGLRPYLCRGASPSTYCDAQSGPRPFGALPRRQAVAQGVLARSHGESPGGIAILPARRSRRFLDLQVAIPAFDAVSDLKVNRHALVVHDAVVSRDGGARPVRRAGARETCRH